MRSICTLPGGLGNFLRCRIGANHCRFRHIGWEKCGHGLTSRPRETSLVAFLSELLIIFRYPPYSAAALLDGVIPPRYCAVRFASRRLLPRGRVLELIGLRGLVGIGQESDQTKNSGTPCETRFVRFFISSPCVEEIERRCVHQQAEGLIPVLDRIGVG